MRFRSEYDRRIVGYAIPALGALAAEPLYVLVDTAVVGHLGRSQLAALGLAATVLSVLAMRLLLMGARFRRRRWLVTGFE